MSAKASTPAASDSVRNSCERRKLNLVPREGGRGARTNARAHGFASIFICRQKTPWTSATTRPTRTRPNSTRKRQDEARSTPTSGWCVCGCVCECAGGWVGCVTVGAFSRARAWVWCCALLCSAANGLPLHHIVGFGTHSCSRNSVPSFVSPSHDNSLCRGNAGPK